MKSDPFQRGSRSGAKQMWPRRAPGGVWPPKSDTSPSSAFLLIGTSGASSAPFHLTPHSSSHHPLPPPLLSSFSCLSSSPVTLLTIPPLSPWNSPKLSFWLLHTFICELLEDNRRRGGWKGVLELEQLLWVMAIHLPPKCALHVNRRF